MRMRAALLTLAIVVVCSQVAADPRHRHVLPPHLTVDEFVAKYRGLLDVPGWQVDQRYAQGYLAGVADVSQGRSWCMPLGFEPGKADDQVVGDVAKLVPELVQRPRGKLPAYAGPVLLERYSARFPIAGSCTVTPHLTGDEVLTHQLVPSGLTKWDQSREDTLKREYAEGYQAGVVDTTHGRSWCVPSRMKPGEVDDRVWVEMKKRRGTMPGNGAKILLDLYNARFPCP